jgi:rubrerythrin
MYEKIRKILKIAMAMEMSDRELYRKVGEKIGDEKIRTLFAFLAKEEEKHFKALFQKFRIHGGEPSFQPEVIAEELQSEKLRLDDRVSILNTCIAREKKGEQMYLDAAKEAENAIIHDFCLYLADQEKEHAKKLQELLEAQPA